MARHTSSARRSLSSLRKRSTQVSNRLSRSLPSSKSTRDGIVAGVNAIQYRVGTVELHKFRCEGDPSESKFDIANPGDEVDLTVYETCVADEKDFTITQFANDVDFDLLAATTTDGSVTIEDVPTTSIFSGRHHIAEDGAKIEGDFDVEPDKTTIIVAVNYTAPLGSLSVTKIVCIGAGDTEFYIDKGVHPGWRLRLLTG